MTTPLDATASRRKWLRAVVGSLVSLGFLWLSFRGVAWRDAWDTILGADLLLLLAALGTVVMTALQKAVRWRLMFYPEHRRLRLSRFFSIFLVGQVINAAIPARIGELARAYLIGNRERVSKAQALWTAVTEKVLDALTLLAFLAGLSLSVSLPTWLQKAGWTLCLFMGAGFLTLGLAAIFQSRVSGWLDRWNAVHPWSRRLRLQRLLTVMIDSLQLMRGPRALFGLLAWSVSAFLTAATTNWVTAVALGMRLSYSACLLLLAVLQISAVVPIPTSPGRVGLFHYLCVISLAAFGVERDAALAYSLVLHVMVYLPMTVGGPIGMWLESCGWRDMSNLLRGSDALDKGT